MSCVNNWLVHVYQIVLWTKLIFHQISRFVKLLLLHQFRSFHQVFLVTNKTVGQYKCARFFGWPKIIWQNKFGFKKNLGPPKKIIERNVCPEKKLAEILKPQKYLGLKQIWNPKINWCRKYFVGRPYWIQPSWIRPSSIQLRTLEASNGPK